MTAEGRALAMRALALAESGESVLRLNRHAYLPLREDAGGRGLNEIIRALPSGRVRLRAYEDGRPPYFPAGEFVTRVVLLSWGSPYPLWRSRTSVLIIAKGTPLRVMRTDPVLELWPPHVAPLGHRWRKLESLIPDPELLL